MAQKVNSNGIRLLLNKKWKSNWYVKLDRNSFSDIMYNDLIIVLYLLRFLFQRHWLATEPYIKRYNKKIIIYFSIFFYKKGRFFMKKKKKKIIKKKIKVKLKKICAYNLIQITKSNHLIFQIKYLKRKYIYCQSFIIAQYIQKLIEKRTRYGLIIKKVIKELKIKKKKSLKGYKISISGRINGNFRAKSKSIHKGSLTLSTLSADLRYTQLSGLNIHGLYGIKVWLSFKKKKKYI